MADVSTVAEGIAATEAGADIVATTLAGYTGNGPPRDGLDLTLVAGLRAALPAVLLIAKVAITTGADAVFVGTAITDPLWITATITAAAQTARPGEAPCR